MIALSQECIFKPLLIVFKELGSMYDYLAKIILLGPSGTGKYVDNGPDAFRAHIQGWRKALKSSGRAVLTCHLDS